MEVLANASPRLCNACSSSSRYRASLKLGSPVVRWKRYRAIVFSQQESPDQARQRAKKGKKCCQNCAVKHEKQFCRAERAKEVVPPRTSAPCGLRNYISNLEEVLVKRSGTNSRKSAITAEARMRLKEISAPAAQATRWSDFKQSVQKTIISLKNKLRRQNVRSKPITDYWYDNGSKVSCSF